MGGQNFFTEKNIGANVKISHIDGRFSLIWITAAIGDVAMCIIIFMGEELSFKQRVGHAIRVVYDKTRM